METTKDVYFQALELLPADMKRGPLRMLEFGCGGGMNLLHLVSVLSRDGFNVASAIGTDFSPVLIQAANKEAQSYLTPVGTKPRSVLRGEEREIA